MKNLKNLEICEILPPVPPLKKPYDRPLAQPDFPSETKEEPLERNPEKTDKIFLKKPEFFHKSAKNPELPTKPKLTHFKDDFDSQELPLDSPKTPKRRNSIDLLIEEQYKPELPHASTDNNNQELSNQFNVEQRSRLMSGHSETIIPENDGNAMRGKSRTVFSKIGCDTTLTSYEEIDPKSLENLMEKLEIFNEKIKVIFLCFF